MQKKLLTCLTAALVLMLALCISIAEEELVEYEPLQPGMSGEEIENLNARLTVLGYLDKVLGAEYDEGTEDAVKAFQGVAGIEATGVADAATQQALMAEDAPVNPENPPKGEMVWISETGKKYHSYWNCGNMQSPTCATKDEAVERGLEPCSKCYGKEDAA